MYLTQRLMRFRWYFSVFYTTEGLSCASVQFAEQRALPLKGWLFFFLRWPKPFAFLAPRSRRTALHEEVVLFILTAWLLSLKLFLDNLLRAAAQSHSSPLTCYFSSQPSTGLNRHIHTVNIPITRSPHIINKLLHCSPISTWKFTSSELAIKKIFLSKQCYIQHSNNMPANTSGFSTQDLLLPDVLTTQKEKREGQ